MASDQEAIVVTTDVIQWLQVKWRTCWGYNPDFGNNWDGELPEVHREGPWCCFKIGVIKNQVKTAVIKTQPSRPLQNCIMVLDERINSTFKRFLINPHNSCCGLLVFDHSTLELIFYIVNPSVDTMASPVSFKPKKMEAFYVLAVGTWPVKQPAQACPVILHTAQ